MPIADGVMSPVGHARGATWRPAFGAEGEIAPFASGAVVASACRYPENPTIQFGSPVRLDFEPEPRFVMSRCDWYLVASRNCRRLDER